MMDLGKVTALRMERQHFTHPASKSEYLDLYRDMQPGQNVYWNGFGDPPSLTYRADFDDMEYNRMRQSNHELLKGRFSGGNLGWIVPEDMELFACAFAKPLSKPNDRQAALLELVEREGPLTIQQMKESTGLLVKEITPALLRLQQAFLIFEDQHDGEWDRGWHMFDEMFPSVSLEKYSRIHALAILLERFAYRHVLFDADMAKSFYKLATKDILASIQQLLTDDVLMESSGGYMLKSDFERIQEYDGSFPDFAYAMHRNDFLVKSNEHLLKQKYTHNYPDTLYYLLIDGEFRGAVAGKFRYTPEVEDVMLDLPAEQATARKEEILQAVHTLCGKDNPILRYQGNAITMRK